MTYLNLVTSPMAGVWTIADFFLLTSCRTPGCRQGLPQMLVGYLVCDLIRDKIDLMEFMLLLTKWDTKIVNSHKRDQLIHNEGFSLHKPWQPGRHRQERSVFSSLHESQDVDLWNVSIPCRRRLREQATASLTNRQAVKHCTYDSNASAFGETSLPKWTQNYYNDLRNMFFAATYPYSSQYHISLIIKVCCKDFASSNSTPWARAPRCLALLCARFFLSPSLLKSLAPTPSSTSYLKRSLLTINWHTTSTLDETRKLSSHTFRLIFPWIRDFMECLSFL